MARLVPTRRERRLKVVESLPLDPSRRLVLVACDGRERLLLLGEGLLLPEIAPDPAPRRRPASKDAQ